MSKSRSSQKKVSLSELNNHSISNKRQALKDLKMLDFNELQYKNPAQKRFYQTISKKDITFGIGVLSSIVFGSGWLGIDVVANISALVGSFLGGGVTGLLVLIVLLSLWDSK